MASYVPKTWKCGPLGKERYGDPATRSLTEAVIYRRVQKYTRLPGLNQDDLKQEARLAATYALDTFDATRGHKCADYVGVIVERALAMVACEVLAKCRQPYVLELRDGQWVSIPAESAELDEHHWATSDNGESGLIDREEKIHQLGREAELYRHVLRAPLTDDGHLLLNLRLSPPMELHIASRNQSGRRGLIASAIASYLGWEQTRLARANKELKQILPGWITACGEQKGR